MKKLMTIFGAFFFASVVLTSCGDVNIEDLDKDIESEEDAVEAMLTLGEAQLDLIVSLKGPVQEVADLKDRFEKIHESSEDVYDQIKDEDLDWEDIIEDNEYEDMQDFVLAMGEAHTVREFVCYAFKAIGVNLNWKGEGIAEVGFHGINNDLLVKVDKKFIRESAEMPSLIGDINKASKLLGWKKKYNFEEMIKDLVFKEIRQLSSQDAEMLKDSLYN